jgi:hypothetical protein
LLRGLKISGTVKDASTGQPIPKFRLIAGWPEGIVMPGETKQRIHWSTIDRFWITFFDGKFDYTFEEPIVTGTKENLFAFKFEAEGYASQSTRIVREEEGSATFEISMKPHAGMLTILAPNGQPAADIDVAFPGRHGFVNLSGASLQRTPNVVARSTDDKGQIAFEPDFEGRIVAAGPAGFAMVNTTELQSDAPTIRLQPWGRVEGRVTRRGKPLTEWEVTVNSKRSSDFVTLSLGQGVKVDENGRFTIPFAPPGQFLVARKAPMDQPNVWSHVPVKDISIQAGETTIFEQDDKGVSVSFRAVWPAAFPRTAEQKIFCNASSIGPRPPPGIEKDLAALSEWRKQPDVIEWMEHLKHYQFRETSPGVWACDDVEPGEYFVGISVMDKMPKQGEPVYPAWASQREFHIAENATDEKIDLGEMVLTKFEPPVSQATPQ